MRHLQSLLFLLILLVCPGFSQAQQLWSGIISPSRAIDWTQAGVVGGIPDANWAQCGSTITPSTGTAATINTQIAGCPANTYVLLGPGTFNLSTRYFDEEQRRPARFGGELHFPRNDRKQRL